jgi:hypothetical protein
VSNIGEAYDGPVDLARLADFEPFIPLPLRNRGTNSLGQQGTCDCGACASSYDAAGSCLPISAPPAPPAPTLEEMRRLSVSNPFAPPAPPYVHKQTWDQRCECNCPGEGTCKFTPAFGDLDAINQVYTVQSIFNCVSIHDLACVAELAFSLQGTCVGYGVETKCECTPPYLQVNIETRCSHFFILTMRDQFIHLTCLLPWECR